MARRATIIDRVFDMWGDEWDVRERRLSTSGLAVLLGWPTDVPRGRGGGGPRVIVTPDLASHMERVRHSPGAHGLPLGSGAIKRVRRLLGHQWRADRALWWEDRAIDLSDLTTAEFAARHAVSVGAVTHARQAMFGPRLRAAGWWRAPEVVEMLLSPRPAALLADMCGITPGSIRRMRAALRQSQPTGHEAVNLPLQTLD